MTWDFATEPEFEKKLDWARTFVRNEVMPLDVDEARLRQLIRPLQQEVKDNDL